MPFSYSFEDINSITIPEKVFNWIDYIIQKNNCFTGNITYIFCSDDYLLSINQKYLKHDYYTDIITFDYCSGKKISGDLFVSIERVFDNAIQFDVSREKELLRVIIHGILHLLGFDDLTVEQEREMRYQEDMCIEIYENKFAK